MAALLIKGTAVLAQDGIIRGKVFDDATGESLIGVTVVLEGTTSGNVTDLDGNFEIRVQPGTYDLKVTYISYAPVRIAGVRVEAGRVLSLEAIRMKEAASKLQEIVVSAEAIRTTEEALLTVKRKSSVVIDGISSASFRKIGDSDAAQAARRVTGVSVEDGKYVYVRGLGDRYTKTTLNHVDIPGLDPDRNAIQIDLFPTSLIDNMVVVKSASADLPADFTGGVVNIETKDFPDERILDVSLNLGYNPSMHFNPDHLTYPGGKRDFLGFDDGTRALPAGADAAVVPTPANGSSPDAVSAFVKRFNPTLGATRRTSFMDYGFGISTANQSLLNNGEKIGYLFSLSYKNESRYYDDVGYGEYQRLSDPEVYEMRYATLREGQIGENNVLWGGLAGLAYKTERSTFKLMFTRLQNGQRRAGNFFIRNNGEAVGQSGYEAISTNLEYSERSVTNVLLHGEHIDRDKRWTIDWRMSPTKSTIDEPDIRRTTFTRGPIQTRFDAGAGGNPTRSWRALEEINLVGKLDVTRTYAFRGEGAKLKFGVSHGYKARNYSILSFDLLADGVQPAFGDHPDPDVVLTSGNVFPDGKFYYASANANPNANAYNSTVHNTGVYISNEFSPVRSLRAVVGIRAEKYTQRHTGRDVAYATLGTGNHLDNAKVLDALDLFPSVNLIYSVNDSQNLRFSYARTIARPSFKELSFAQIIDPLTNRIFNGGLFSYSDWDGKLTETRINNVDVRWERFRENGQTVSLSGFYKAFTDPIELVRIPEQQTSTEYQPRNVGNGRLFGAELEFRRGLAFVSPILANFSVNGNVTVVKSVIDMTEREFSARKRYERDGETVSQTRRMAGQAPYIFNGGLSYSHTGLGIDAGLFYNVKGPTLAIVGAGLFPDIYTQPFHGLNVNAIKSFGVERRMAVSLGVANVLNDGRADVYVAHKAADRYFNRYHPGVQVSASVKYSF